jgi:hypothetical protein
MIEFKPNWKRRKIAYIPISSLKNYFGNWKLSGHTILQEFPECENAEIIDVFMDYPRRMFGVVLASPDWPEVEDGCVPPEIGTLSTRERIVSTDNTIWMDRAIEQAARGDHYFGSSNVY